MCEGKFKSQCQGEISTEEGTGGPHGPPRISLRAAGGQRPKGSIRLVSVATLPFPARGRSRGWTLCAGSSLPVLWSLMSLQPGPSSPQGLTSGLPWASPLGPRFSWPLGPMWSREIRSRKSDGREVCRVAGDGYTCQQTRSTRKAGHQKERCRSTAGAQTEQDGARAGTRERSRSSETLIPFLGLAAPSAENRLPRK